MNNPKKEVPEKRSDGEFDHLSDYVDSQESTKEALKSGLLSFLKHVEQVENEKLHMKG